MKNVEESQWIAESEIEEKRDRYILLLERLADSGKLEVAYPIYGGAKALNELLVDPDGEIDEHIEFVMSRV